MSHWGVSPRAIIWKTGQIVNLRLPLLPDSPMPKPSDHKADCYSHGERAWMEYGQQLRASWLDGSLRWLTRWGVTPDRITLLSCVSGLAFVPLWLTEQTTLAIATLVAHVLLDGLDGPLARYQQVASPRGSFTDTFTDQLVVTGVTIAWMIHAPTAKHILAGSLYVYLYALVVAMAMVRNALAVPYSWLVRPRFFVYLAIIFDRWLNSDWTVMMLLLCNFLLAIKSISGFLAVRRSLPGPARSLPRAHDEKR